MSATLAHDVDMATDLTAAVPAAAAEATTTSPGPSAAVSKHASSSTRKEPPLEKPSDVRRRSQVIFSFWLIVLCLGLPIWWHTTAIPRANLPLDDMMNWADGKVGHVDSLFRLLFFLACLGIDR